MLGGKYSLKLDLKSSVCREQLKVLLRDADVVICNIREESIKRLGLDYERYVLLWLSFDLESTKC